MISTKGSWSLLYRSALYLFPRHAWLLSLQEARRCKLSSPVVSFIAGSISLTQKYSRCHPQPYANLREAMITLYISFLWLKPSSMDMLALENLVAPFLYLLSKLRTATWRRERERVCRQEGESITCEITAAWTSGVPPCIVISRKPPPGFTDNSLVALPRYIPGRSARW